jgi:CBS domain-containing protein
MSRAKDLMRTNVPTLDANDSVDKAMSLMLERGLSGLPVIDPDGRLLGYLSEFDLIELFRDPKTSQDRVYHYMTRQLHQVAEDAELQTVAEQFRTSSIRQLLITRDEQLVGTISRADLLAWILQSRQQVLPPVAMPLPINVAVPTPGAW